MCAKKVPSSCPKVQADPQDIELAQKESVTVKIGLNIMKRLHRKKKKVGFYTYFLGNIFKIIPY